MLNSAYQSAADEYYNRPRPSIVSQVPEGPNIVLDIGCGAGGVGRSLIANGKAGRVVGVELFAPAAKAASEIYANVHTGDIEAMELPYESVFDYIICGDILEHLKDPAIVVAKVHRWLKDDGVFICSVPNIRHWQVLYQLAFRGAWDYVDAGVLDKTHLRFFTRRSFYRMLVEGDFAITASQMLIYSRRYQILNRITLRLFEDLLGSQLVVRARKVASRLK
jgi:2-polyprenyl-3-methyl-5-hydroxy-6-metoxy-1,4-benzoquinol methylase